MLENKKTSGKITIIIIILAAIAALITATYFLTQGKKTTSENQPTQATVTYLAMLDETNDIGPTNENLIKLNHTNWPKKGTKVSENDQLTWSGEIVWKGPAEENMGSYGRDNLNVHLILARASGTEDLYIALLLGPYPGEGKVPMGEGATGDFQYINHDSQTFQELGGNTQASVNFNLTVTYE